MQQYHLHLKGFVGGPDFDKNYVDYILNKNANNPVNVLIDSLGGSLATALSIASAFRNHGQVTVHFVGMNASAATIASLGAARITMDSSAMYLAHKCSTEFFQWAQLNADQLQAEIDSLTQLQTDLQKMDLNVANLYARKSGKDPKELLELMKVGGWLTSKEALQWGLVDEITDTKDANPPVLTDALASAMASAGMPIPNIPVQGPTESQLSRFLSALASLFKTSAQTPKNESDMNKFPLLAAVFASHKEQFSEADLTLTDAQCAALEQHLASLQAEHQSALEEKQTVIAQRDATIAGQATRINELTASITEKDNQIADLNKKVQEQATLLAQKPGASTSQVLSGGNGAKTEVEQFFDTNNEARALFSLLP